VENTTYLYLYYFIAILDLTKKNDIGHTSLQYDSDSKDTNNMDESNKRTTKNKTSNPTHPSHILLPFQGRLED